MNSQRFGIQIQRQFLLLCLMLFGLGVNSFAAPGDLDLSFGSGGKVLTNVNNGGTVITSITAFVGQGA